MATTTAQRYKVLRLDKGEWVFCGEYPADSPAAAARAAQRDNPGLWFRTRAASLPRELWRDYLVG